jgi:hypothetical protein
VGHAGETCSSRTRAAARSDSKASPAWGRRGGGDDRWAPVVSLSGGESGAAAAGGLAWVEKAKRAGAQGGRATGLQGGHGLLPSELGRWLASAGRAAAQAAAAAGLLDGLGRTE